MKANLAYFTALLLLPLAALQAAAAPLTKPNIVFFLVDDMGWQETSVPFHSEVTALNRRYRTPNMERLAAHGMKFTQAYASAVCSPTRVSALTGMNVARHRVTNWTLRKDRSPDNAHKTLQPPDWNLNGICTNAGLGRTMQVTPMPALLRTAGYRTIHVGKAHFGAKETPGENPLNLGFDVNIAGHAPGGPGSYWGEKNFSAAWRKEDRIWDVPGLEAYHGTNIYLTEALTREAIKAVEKAVADQQPFYLYLSHYAIHAPWEKDDRFYQKYIDAGLKPFEATLASMIEGMDKSLGDVMNALDRLGIADNTVLLFMSDNGAPSQCPKNLPLRGHKLTPYEGGIREPMIVKWPGVTKPASVCREPLVIEDFFPTILELAGADWRGKTLQTVDGISFVPLLKGEGRPPTGRAFVWHFPHNYGQTPFSAIRQGPWKLIYHHADRRLELFNIDEDIGETRDLAKGNPAKVTALAKLLSERLRDEQAQMPVDKATGQPVPLPDASSAAKSPNAANSQRFRVLSFNILEGGNPSAAGVGFYEKDFGGSRRDVVAKVMRDSGADVICVQEDDASGKLLAILGANWQRAGTIYSRLPLTPVTTNAYFSLGRVQLGATQSVMVANTHWWPKADGTEIIRKQLVAGTLPTDLAALEREVLKTSDSTSGPRGYQRTLDAVGPLLKAGERVILAGDLNEPSHLDWTQHAADKGMDRLVKNPTSTPLRFKIEWRGSKLLEQLGLRDAYRTVFPDEVVKPGNTWTPPYPNGTPGRRPWDDQVLTRIDQIYFGGGLRAVDAAVIGESAETSEIVFSGRWPSDHRAVLATFAIEAGSPKPSAAIQNASPLKVPESSLAKALVWQGIAIEETNYTIWGASPVVADGTVHLFAARWPEANVDPAWRKSSEIAHYVADKPAGPFRFHEVVLKGTGRTGEWDAFAPHNPEIQRFGDTFALCFIANSDFHQPPHPLNQQVGMVISDSVNGPWKKVGKDGLILGPSSNPRHFTHGKQIVNPALLKVGGKFHLYFKTGGPVRGTTVYGLAIADQLTGPYRMLDEPLTSKGVTIEDGSAFQWDGKVCLLTTDNHGKVTGIRGGGALWVSDDGIHFKPEWTQLGFALIPRYFAGYDPARVKKVYGGDPKFERPKVLCVDGRPAWLFAPSGWNVTGGQRTVSHVLKINLQPGDGPLSGTESP